MKQPLDQLVQRFEQIVQQLKILEVMFSSTSHQTRSHRSLTDWKNIINLKTDSSDSNSSKQLFDRLFQVDEARLFQVDEDGSKE